MICPILCSKRCAGWLIFLPMHVRQRNMRWSKRLRVNIVDISAMSLRGLCMILIHGTTMHGSMLPME